MSSPEPTPVQEQDIAPEGLDLTRPNSALTTETGEERWRCYRPLPLFAGHAAICAVSVAAACVCFEAIYARSATATTLARLFRMDVDGFVLFLALFYGALLLCLRPRPSKSLWPIVTGAILGNICTVAAYALYVLAIASIHPVASDFVHAMAPQALPHALITVGLILPFVTPGWLFGVLTGGLIVLCRAAVRALTEHPQ